MTDKRVMTFRCRIGDRARANGIKIEPVELDGPVAGGLWLDDALRTRHVLPGDEVIVTVRRAPTDGKNRRK